MLKRVIILGVFGAGIFLMVQVVMPIISYKIWEMGFYQDNIVLTSPLSKNDNVLGISVEDRDSFPALISDKSRRETLPYQVMFLSIPSIKLEKVEVQVESNNFEQSLAHLPGSALPGERGNVFITGHSSLPQFYRPGNFKAIFSNLPNIKKGDQILIEAGGQTFKYSVVGLQIVNPSETWVINPPDDKERYLSLMTCVPPGLYIKRLVVLAKII